MPSALLLTQVYNGLTSQAIADSDHRTTGTGTPKNQITTTVKNARGDTLSVTDAMPTPNTINYTYDAAGNLTHIVDPDSNTIVIEYDVRGNKKRQNDPDMGEWFYTYNALDQLVLQVDANGNRIEYSYDLIGRPDARTNWIMKTEGLELESTAKWYYDGTGVGAKLGFLRREEHRDGLGRFINRKTFAYDAYCRPMFELRNYDSKWYYTTLRYDAFSRVEYVDRFWRPVGKEGPASQLDPEWQSVSTKNTYNQYGALLSVTDPSDNSVWWSCDAGDYDQQGRLTEYLYGNGLSTFTDYDAQTGLIEGLDIKTGGWTLSDYAFGYDRLGNLTSRVHTRPMKATLTENCTYDALNRLGSGSVTGPVNFSTDATYDALGNIQTRTGITGSYTYYANRPHAVYTAGNCTYYYDANGNVVRRDRNSQYEFTANWTSFNKPSSVFSGQEGSEFEYDVNGKRTKQLIFEDDGSGGIRVRKKIYVAETYEIEEVLSNPTQTDRSLWVWTPVHSRIYIDTPAGRVGIYQKAASSDGSGTVTKSWLHKDHLGSVIAISDINQSITYQSYDAWGNPRDPDDWTALTTSPASSVTDRGYTGHEMLSHLDLVHMNGRIYDPVIGRFISPDPIIQAPQNLQSYNRYSYVMNRPLSSTDPSGFDAIIKKTGSAQSASTQDSGLAEKVTSEPTSLLDSVDTGVKDSGSEEASNKYYIGKDGSLKVSVEHNPSTTNAAAGLTLKREKKEDPYDVIYGPKNANISKGDKWLDPGVKLIRVENIGKMKVESSKIGKIKRITQPADFVYEHRDGDTKIVKGELFVPCEPPTEDLIKIGLVVFGSVSYLLDDGAALTVDGFKNAGQVKDFVTGDAGVLDYVNPMLDISPQYSQGVREVLKQYGSFKSMYYDPAKAIYSNLEQAYQDLYSK